METLWIVALATFLVGYFALEGMVIGAGMLMGIRARSERDRSRLAALLGRFFLASEIWLVAAVGVLFGAFPKLEGAIMSGLFPVVIAFLVCWILRSSGLWFRGRIDARGWRLQSDSVICLGSWGMAACWGIAFATFWRGLPTASAPDGQIDPWASFAHPAAAVGVLGMVTVLWIHGSAFVASRLTEQSTMAAGPKLNSALHPRLALRPKLTWTTLLAITPAAAVLIGSASTLSANIAPHNTLQVLTLIAAPCLPLLLLGQVWAWRVMWKFDSAAPSYF